MSQLKISLVQGAMKRSVLGIRGIRQKIKVADEDDARSECMEKLKEHLSRCMVRLIDHDDAECSRNTRFLSFLLENVVVTYYVKYRRHSPKVHTPVEI